MPKPNKAAEQAESKSHISAVDLKPKFRTPHEGGSYVISKEEAVKPGAAPVFVEGTDRDATPAEKSAADSIISGSKAAKSTPSNDQASVG